MPQTSPEPGEQPGGKDPRPTGSRAILQAIQALLEGRLRNRDTTRIGTSSRAAITVFSNPAAAISTIFARTTS